MAKYMSKFPELGFYVDGSIRRFSGGLYTTEDKMEIEVLDKLTDAQKAEEAPKATTKKAPAKSSGK